MINSDDYSLQIADTQLRARAAIAARAARMLIALGMNVFMGVSWQSVRGGVKHCLHIAGHFLSSG